MEIRCGGCNKLFRIPDEKITGKGIKFSCTRCGEIVKVINEEFEHYSISKSAVAALDLLEKKSKPAPTPEQPGEKTVSEDTAPVVNAEEPAGPAAPIIQFDAQIQPAEEHPQISETTAIPEQKEFENTPSPVPDIPHEEQAQQSADPEPSDAQAATSERAFLPASPAESSTPELPSEQVQPNEPVDSSPAGAWGIQVAGVSDEVKSEPVAAQEPAVALHEEHALENEQLPVPEPLPPQPALIAEQKQTAIAEPAPSLKPVTSEPMAESRLEKEQGPDTAYSTRPAKTANVPPVTPSIPRHEPATRSTAATIRSVPVAPETPSRSVNMFLVYSLMLIIIVLVGYGVFTYIGPKTQHMDEMLKELSSTEGLRITSASGSVDASGDLLITCVVENALDKERPVWYVVVDLYNAQGSVLGKIRAINGKQLFTQRDYDILSKRGMNTQEMKAKNLEDQGVIILPKGSVTFELRYVQPLSAVASFNTSVKPFDPVRTYKELAEEIQQ